MRQYRLHILSLGWLFLLAGRLDELESDYGKEMVLKVVEMFLPDAESRIERIDQAIKQSDFKALEEAAHGLKSGAANVGATEMAQLCEALEMQGEVKSLDDAPEMVKLLLKSWTKVKIELDRYRTGSV